MMLAGLLDLMVGEFRDLPVGHLARARPARWPPRRPAPRPRGTGSWESLRAAGSPPRPPRRCAPMKEQTTGLFETLDRLGHDARRLLDLGHRLRGEDDDPHVDARVLQHGADRRLVAVGPRVPDDVDRVAERSGGRQPAFELVLGRRRRASAIFIPTARPRRWP